MIRTHIGAVSTQVLGKWVHQLADSEGNLGQPGLGVCYSLGPNVMRQSLNRTLLFEHKGGCGPTLCHSQADTGLHKADVQCTCSLSPGTSKLNLSLDVIDGVWLTWPNPGSISGSSYFTEAAAVHQCELHPQTHLLPSLADRLRLICAFPLHAQR